MLTRRTHCGGPSSPACAQNLSLLFFEEALRPECRRVCALNALQHSSTSRRGERPSAVQDAEERRKQCLCPRSHVHRRRGTLWEGAGERAPSCLSLGSAPDTMSYLVSVYVTLAAQARPLHRPSL